MNGVRILILSIFVGLPCWARQDEKARLVQEQYWEVSKSGEAGDTGFYRRPDDAFALPGPYHNFWSRHENLIYGIRELKGINTLWTLNPKTKKTIHKVVLPKEYAPVILSASFLLEGRVLLAGLKDCLIYDVRDRKSTKVDVSLLYDRGARPSVAAQVIYQPGATWFTAVVDDVSQPDCSAGLVRFRFSSPKEIVRIPLPRALPEGTSSKGRHEHQWVILGETNGILVLQRGMQTSKDEVFTELFAVDLAKKKVIASKKIDHTAAMFRINGDLERPWKNRILVGLGGRPMFLDPKTLETAPFPLKWKPTKPLSWFFLLEGTAVFICTTGEYILFDPKSYEVLGSGIFIDKIVGGLNSIGKKGDRLWVFQCDYGPKPLSETLLKTKRIKDHYLLFKLKRDRKP